MTSRSVFEKKLKSGKMSQSATTKVKQFKTWNVIIPYKMYGIEGMCNSTRGNACEKQIKSMLMSPMKSNTFKLISTAINKMTEGISTRKIYERMY